MPFDYKKLLMLLLQKDMKKNLEEQAGLSSAAIAKLTKGKTMSTEILERIWPYSGLRCRKISEHWKG